MLTTVLRKEHKNQWEKRTCLTPDATQSLIEKGYRVDVESSDIRIFPDSAYRDQNCKIIDSPDAHQFILGIKEPPVTSIKKGQVHLAFSHTHKGQGYNMPLLQKFIDEKATLFDYELIIDEKGIRTIAFGRYAGIAGAVDTLALAGEKLSLNGVESSLKNIKQSWQYQQETIVKQALEDIDINKGAPIRVLIVGSGKVGKGSEEVCQWLGLNKLSASDFLQGKLPEGSFYCVLSAKYLYRKKNDPSASPESFNFADFLEKGKTAYDTIFPDLLGKFDVFLHTPYWEEKYPSLLPLEVMQKYQGKLPIVIGDITCDINGSLACTKKNTDTDNPAITYFPETDSYVDGVKSEGVTVMAIDNLPCELSRDASEHFSSILPGYIPLIMDMDLSLSWSDLNLAGLLKRAVIVYNGKLTPNFQYLKEFL